MAYWSFDFELFGIMSGENKFPENQKALYQIDAQSMCSAKVFMATSYSRRPFWTSCILSK